MHTAQQNDGTEDHPVESCLLEVSTDPRIPLSTIPWYQQQMTRYHQIKDLIKIYFKDNILQANFKSYTK